MTAHRCEAEACSKPSGRSPLSPATRRRAVADGDVKALQRAPGVGKRLAERMALELKGKLDGFLLPDNGGGGQDGEQSAPGADADDSAVSEATVAQVVEALVGLGFTGKSAAPTVAAVAAEMDSAPDPSVLLRACLARIGGQK